MAVAEDEMGEDKPIESEKCFLCGILLFSRFDSGIALGQTTFG